MISAVNRVSIAHLVNAVAAASSEEAHKQAHQALNQQIFKEVEGENGASVVSELLAYETNSKSPLHRVAAASALINAVDGQETGKGSLTLSLLPLSLMSDARLQLPLAFPHTAHNMRLAGLMQKVYLGSMPGSWAYVVPRAYSADQLRDMDLGELIGFKQEAYRSVTQGRGSLTSCFDSAPTDYASGIFTLYLPIVFFTPATNTTVNQELPKLVGTMPDLDENLHVLMADAFKAVNLPGEVTFFAHWSEHETFSRTTMNSGMIEAAAWLYLVGSLNADAHDVKMENCDLTITPLSSPFDSVQSIGFTLKSGDYLLCAAERELHDCTAAQFMDWAQDLPFVVRDLTLEPGTQAQVQALRDSVDLMLAEVPMLA